ncbi:hypothetical protein EYF80_027013 [Liparis tanakae]|uniref:Ciliary neurotrophic factor n=1 Tax=Liparis tanakae TaxID=230148 RepID=A0A4Z2HA60_9TELE|nr:hypothetical protein EYF80_027013 [Liparis tanakae]
MAARRTRGVSGSTVARATALAEQLRLECSILLELYVCNLFLITDLAERRLFGNIPGPSRAPGNRCIPAKAPREGRLVSVLPPSAQLDTGIKLRRLHSALLKCRVLLENAIAREEEELGGGQKGDYETQRKMVRDRLSFLLIVIEELLKAAGGNTTTPTPELESGGSNGLFELKLWVYRIFKEVNYWAKTAITILQSLPSPITRERVMMTTRARSRRSTRR